METYSALAYFNDTWHLVFMTALFVAIVIYVLRPGSRTIHRDIANSIFRNDDRPAAAPKQNPDEGGR